MPPEAPDFVQRITAMMLEGNGDLLPVSALPVDGSFPTDTARWERRSIAREIPIWDPAICIDCAKCALVCPHAAIRMKVFEPSAAEGGPVAFQTKEWRDREHPGRVMTIQVAPDDCTGCGVCVDVCPARSKTEVKHKAIDMLPKEEHLEVERANWDFFLTIPDPDRHEVRADTVKGSQQLRPLFEFSGACAGCGETPYLKVLTQLFGDRMIVANATGCSSIYGGNLPTTPWAVDAAGRGPAWANSLFEDNAEFGLGMRLALDAKRTLSVSLLKELSGAVGEDLASDLIAGASLHGDDVVVVQRERIAMLRERLRGIEDPRARNLETAAEALDPAERVDRRRRRLGLRHRVRRARPRARERARRERPRARHRGLLEHRRAGVEVDAARRRREVRGGRQEPGQEGPRDDRDGLRRRLRRDRSRWAPTCRTRSRCSPRPRRIRGRRS